MTKPTNSIPNATIEAIARSLFRETTQYGFKQVDYLRFVNLLLDMSMKNGYPAVEISCASKQYQLTEAIDFPLIGEAVKIHQFDDTYDKPTIAKWLGEGNGKNFLICRITGYQLDLNWLVNSDRNRMGMITLHNNEESPIGLLAFIDYDKIQRKAELRELIGEVQYKGRDIVREAIQLWIQFGISNLGLKKIYLNSLDTNIRNIKLNEDLGFKVEGILRNECCIDGKYHDVLKMGYLVE